MAWTPRMEVPSPFASSPATDGDAITPSDSQLAKNTRALYVGASGDLHVVLADSSDQTKVLTIAGAAVGYHPLVCSYVKAATTASQIIGLY